MGLHVGAFLKSATSGEERFRISSLIDDGRSYFIAEGADSSLDDMRVILKAIKYSDKPSLDEVKDRREALQLELEALTSSSPLLPEPLDFIQVHSDLDIPGNDNLEPVLVLEFQSGRTLRQEVARGTSGMEPKRALRIVHELALTLEGLHSDGFVFRDLNPDHIIIGLDDIIHLVGTGNIARIQKRPLRHKIGTSDAWSAPEIRNELSGKFLTPASDIYSLGALLAFLLSGIPTTSVIESPLSPSAYNSLSSMPEGYQLLIAKCLQPMAKHRFSKLSKLIPFLDPKNLPHRGIKAFAKVELPAHFDSGPSSFDNRASRSNLSRGPLLSEPRKLPAKVENSGPPAKQEPWYKGCLFWMNAAMFLLLAASAFSAWMISVTL